MMNIMAFCMFGVVIHILTAFMLYVMDEDHERVYPFVMVGYVIIWWIIFIVKHL